MSSDNEVDPDKLYRDAKEYWKKIPPTVDGMLGGYANISTTDINGSKAFIRPFLTTGKGLTNTGRALDCGSGIGRITKRLLLPTFKIVDMVELSQKFLDAAGEFIGEDHSRVGSKYCTGLQDFVPDKQKYDVIWVQWVLGHLTDDDYVKFLQRCQEGLTENGILVIKDNFSSEKNFDDEDSSYIRTKDDIEFLIAKSGLTILSQQKQKGFPKTLYDVYMYALQ